MLSQTEMNFSSSPPYLGRIPSVWYSKVPLWIAPLQFAAGISRVPPGTKYLSERKWRNEDLFRKKRNGKKIMSL